jgi:hypothetical protein
LRIIDAVLSAIPEYTVKSGFKLVG